MNVHSCGDLVMAKNDKRDEIVRAALELIAEHGFHGAPGWDRLPAALALTLHRRTECNE